jgi:hypothetical protein
MAEHGFLRSLAVLRLKKSDRETVSPPQNGEEIRRRPDAEEIRLCSDRSTKSPVVNAEDGMRSRGAAL